MRRRGDDEEDGEDDGEVDGDDGVANQNKTGVGGWGREGGPRWSRSLLSEDARGKGRRRLFSFVVPFVFVVFVFVVFEPPSKRLAARSLPQTFTRMMGMNRHRPQDERKKKGF